MSWMSIVCGKSLLRVASYLGARTNARFANDAAKTEVIIPPAIPPESVSPMDLKKVPDTEGKEKMLKIATDFTTTNAALNLSGQPLSIPKPTVDSVGDLEPPNRKVDRDLEAIQMEIWKDLQVVKHDYLATTDNNEALRKSIPFDEVPGPLLLRHIAQAWRYLPVMGSQVTTGALQYLLNASKILGNQLTWGKNLALFRWLLDEYGPVVRLHGPFGGDIVILSRPEHACAIFQNEGRYPIRSSLDCVEKYRLQARKYKLTGPFLMFGPEWERVRKTLDGPLQDCVAHQQFNVAKTCDQFVDRIRSVRNRQDEVSDNFIDEIYKWSMECLFTVCFNKHFGFMDPKGLSSTSEPAQLLEGLAGATDAIRRCEYGFHFWKFIQTPAWKNLMRHCDTLDAILAVHINRVQDVLRLKKEHLALDSELSLMETLLLTNGIMPEDALTILLDMLLIGVNATSHSVSFVLYHLARYPRAQRLLYQEISTASEVESYEDLAKLPYLQACIKESLRLKPPMPTLTRVLSKDTVVDNFRIPKGTSLLIATHLSSLREEYFEEAHKFKPERWLNIDDITTDMQGFATMPFGYGAKSCMARKLAEMQLGMILVKVMRKFRIEYHYGDINSTYRLLSAPNRPLRFRFIERK